MASTEHFGSLEGMSFENFEKQNLLWERLLWNSVMAAMDLGHGDFLAWDSSKPKAPKIFKQEGCALAEKFSIFHDGSHLRLLFVQMWCSEIPIGELSRNDVLSTFIRNLTLFCLSHLKNCKQGPY